ncbi:hypothetical protein SOVF_117000 [Spinacia oleracea]|nr:hypothetical protein SOVF_117000 [Spinacia oleracea]
MVWSLLQKYKPDSRTEGLIAVGCMFLVAMRCDAIL